MFAAANVKVVLVATSHPGNIGAAARAMKTMGLSNLALVAPKAFPHTEATAMAAGADDILARCTRFPTLARAVADGTLVVGCSARPRTLSLPCMTAREAGVQIAAAAGNGRVSVVFGNERTGLTNDELDRCHRLVHIPANPAYSSLNLAAAVQVLSYEIRVAFGDVPNTPVTGNDRDLPDAGEMEHFYEHMERVLLASGFLDPSVPRHLMRRLRHLFNRAAPDRNELNILRGILTSVDRPKRRGRDR